MRIRYCPKCGKAGLKWDDASGKGIDGLTDKERYEQYTADDYQAHAKDFSMRYCPRCQEWVKPDLSRNYDQHKIR